MYLQWTTIMHVFLHSHDDWKIDGNELHDCSMTNHAIIRTVNQD